MTEKVKQLTYSALMCAMIIASTLWIKFTLPGTDVLFTTQVFFVLLCGYLLPVRYCFLSIGTYLFLGLIGIPVFSATQGMGVIVTPSFGYLLAFPFTAAAVSWARTFLGERMGARLAAAALGICVMYLIALSYIAALRGLYLSTPVPFQTLLLSYCLAFLPLDIVKGVLAAMLSVRLEKPLGIRRQAAR